MSPNPNNPLLLASATRLAKLIREREVTSEQIVRAHVARAETINPTINAIVADRFEAAIDEARQADAAIERGETSLGPLHGVPCTIKESFALSGMPNSAGLVARKDYRSESDAVSVRRLREAGAIPLGVTNTSELCMWFESINNVYGRTNNPYDPSRIVGGSSGGEGAIVGSGASPFGLGSDIGGSIRMPAFFNGVFGHKGSQGIIPNTGQYPIGDGNEPKYLCAGPLARRAEDLELLVRVMMGPDGEDEYARDVELGDPNTVSLRGLKVYNVETNHFRHVSRELLANQRRVAGSLAEAGALVETLELPELKHTLDYWGTALSSGGGTTFHEMLGEGTPPNLAAEFFKWAIGRSNHTLPALGLALAEHIPFLNRKDDPKVIAATDAFRAHVHEMLDPGCVMLFPAHTRVAPHHYHPLLTPLDFVYTAIFNVLQLPVTQVPTGLNSKGIPMGIQVVGPDLGDHLTMAIALHIERAFGGWVWPG